jgi:hypothetical protein
MQDQANNYALAAKEYLGGSNHIVAHSMGAESAADPAGVSFEYQKAMQTWKATWTVLTEVLVSRRTNKHVVSGICAGVVA